MSPNLLSLLLSLLSTILSLAISSHLPPSTPHSGGCAWKVTQPLNTMAVCRKLRSTTGKLLFSRDFEFWCSKGRALRWWIQGVPAEFGQHIRSLRNAVLTTVSVEHGRRRAGEEARKFGLREGTTWVVVHDTCPGAGCFRETTWVNCRGIVEKGSGPYPGTALHI